MDICNRLSLDGRYFGMECRRSKPKSWQTESHLQQHCLIGRSSIGSRSPVPVSRSRITPMPNKHPQMKLSHDEEIFLRHWIFDEMHYCDGQGPAKRLQIAHRVRPADIAVLIAASIPDLAEQEAIAHGPPPE